MAFLGTSGQNVDDVFLYSGQEDRLDILESLLAWGHLIPTAPDTLGAYPFQVSIFLGTGILPPVWRHCRSRSQSYVIGRFFNMKIMCKSFIHPGHLRMLRVFKALSMDSCTFFLPVCPRHMFYVLKLGLVIM